MTRPPIHPGEVLADELAAAGLDAEALARQIKVPVKRVTQIVNGQRGITGDMALRLGHWFGTSAQYWMNLQGAYELRMAAVRAGAEIERLPVRAGVVGDVINRPRRPGRLAALLASWGPLEEDSPKIEDARTEAEDIC